MWYHWQTGFYYFESISGSPIKYINSQKGYVYVPNINRSTKIKTLEKVKKHPLYNNNLVVVKYLPPLPKPTTINKGA